MANDTAIFTPSALTVVQGVYEAFGRGDVPAILALCAPDVTWEVVGRPGGYPLWQTWRGQQGGAAFFATVAAHEQFSDFTVREMHDGGDLVTVQGHAAYTITTSGKTVDTDFVHLFRLRDGRIVSFREFSDTAQVAAAFRG